MRIAEQLFRGGKKAYDKNYFIYQPIKILTMSADKINKLFDDLKNTFDVEEPNSGHSQRFLNKLKSQSNSYETPIASSVYKLWKPMVGIAAALLLLMTLVLSSKNYNKVRDLANVSPEMEKTQSFFANTISVELKKLENESHPEAKKIIRDALIQIKKLEVVYEHLKEDLTKSGNDNRVIFAMIKNFQSRIDILQNTLLHIENIKNLTHEKYSNI